jgi:hypothetical protein
MINGITELVKTAKKQMAALGITRLTIGQQVVAKVALADFLEAFGHETKCYKLGSEIRYDVAGITFVANDEKGTTKEV